MLTLINPEFFYSRSGIISAAKLAEETGDVMLARVQSLQISMRNEAPLPNPLELGELTRSTILMGMADGKNSMNAIAEELEFFGYKVLDKTPNPFAKNLNERGTYYQFSPMFSAIPDAKAP